MNASDRPSWLRDVQFTTGESYRQARLKVALVWTGGTFASGKDDEGVIVPKYDADTFLHEFVPEWLKQKYSLHTHVPDGLPPRGIDSTEMDTDRIQRLISKIHEVITHEIAGVIVTHGTDTLAESAQATALALRNAPVPIVFTGSQLNPEEDRQDAIPNLSTALAVCRSQIRETCIAFGPLVFRGIASQKEHGRAADAFRSPHQPALASFDAGEIVVESHARLRKGNELPTDIEYFNKFSGNISSLPMSTTLTGKQLTYHLNSPDDGLLIEGYGEGNIPVERDTFRKRIEDAIKKRNKVVIVTPQCASNDRPSKYGVSANVAHPLITSGHGMTRTAALLKFKWLHALGKAKGVSEKNLPNFIRDSFPTNFVGERAVNGCAYPNGNEN